MDKDIPLKWEGGERIGTVVDIREDDKGVAAKALLSEKGKAKFDELTAADSLARLEGAVRQRTLGSLKGPSPTPPGATRDPSNPGITHAPPTNKRRAARAARRLNRRG